MKKFLIVFLVFVVAVALVASMGCKASATGPTDAQKTATSIAATETAIPPPVYQTFTTASSTGGWENPNMLYNSELALTGIGWDGTEGHAAAGSVSCTADFRAGVLGQSKGDIKLEPASTINLYGKTISVWIKVPQSMVDKAAYRVSFYLLDGPTSHRWRSGGYIPITTADWTQYSVSVSDMASTAGNIPELTYKLGIRIDRLDAYVSDASKDISGVTVYFDDIQY